MGNEIETRNSDSREICYHVCDFAEVICKVLETQQVNTVLSRKKKNHYRKQRQISISAQVFMIFGHCQNHQN